jgi:hypothetical protein
MKETCFTIRVSLVYNCFRVINSLKYAKIVDVEILSVNGLYVLGIF